MANSETTKQVIEYAQPYKVELTRGVRGGYGWTITIRDSDADNLLTELADIDRELRERYGAAHEAESVP